uniref:HMA domain-containing protein n=1 Tax=Steinernema glaseri TaxID=37863 RepID=A0A1I7ZKS6_9BILA
MGVTKIVPASSLCPNGVFANLRRQPAPLRPVYDLAAQLDALGMDQVYIKKEAECRVSALSAFGRCARGRKQKVSACHNDDCCPQFIIVLVFVVAAVCYI